MGCEVIVEDVWGYAPLENVWNCSHQNAVFSISEAEEVVFQPWIVAQPLVISWNSEYRKSSVSWLAHGKQT